MPAQFTNPRSSDPARTVIAAKKVDLVLLTYVNERQRRVSQLAIVGENSVHLLEARVTALSAERSIEGAAPAWLTSGVFAKLNTDGVPETELDEDGWPVGVDAKKLAPKELGLTGTEEKPKRIRKRKV